VVCAPLEAAKVKEVCGADFLTVTPAIPLRDSVADEQTASPPGKAREGQSDLSSWAAP
jgi:orotidine-5'-phosphate decarboxylase